MPDSKIGKDLEITPEMIEAGASALCLWEPHHRLETVACSVFSAMISASPVGARAAQVPSSAQNAGETPRELTMAKDKSRMPKAGVQYPKGDDKADLITRMRKAFAKIGVKQAA